MTMEQVRNPSLYSDVGRANLFANGGFENWSRGTSGFTQANSPNADKWQPQTGGGSTATFARIASTIGRPGYSGQMVYTHAAGGNMQWYQIFGPAGTPYLGRMTISMSLKVKSTVAGTVAASIYCDTGGAISSYNVGTGEETITVTNTIGAAWTVMSAGIMVTNASCTVEINDAMLVMGSQPADFQPMYWTDDRARTLADTGWIQPTLANSWTHYGQPWGPVYYRKTLDSQVIIRGITQNGTQNNAIFTLPVGYRPIAVSGLFACAMNAGVCRINVNADGTVVAAEALAGTWNNGWISLNGISFFTDQ